jgi:hypothetical protein
MGQRTGPPKPEPLRLTMADDGPRPSCPKCGASDGWTGPTFLRTSQVDRASAHGLRWSTVEFLTYACRRCGFERTEATKDAPPSRPPPEPPNVSSLGSELKRSGPGWWRRVMAGWVVGR